MPIVKQSAYSFAETVARLSQSITEAGGTIFATIDQSAAATQAGLTLRPTTLILFGNPSAGTSLMEAFPLVGLDLPLKLLVWEDGGTVNVAYTPVSEIASRYGVTGIDPLIGTLDAGVAKFAISVAAI
jgi:uncharacterized protein (DUF302 family)